MVKLSPSSTPRVRDSAIEKIELIKQKTKIISFLEMSETLNEDFLYKYSAIWKRSLNVGWTIYTLWSSLLSYNPNCVSTDIRRIRYRHFRTDENTILPSLARPCVTASENTRLSSRPQ